MLLFMTAHKSHFVGNEIVPYSNSQMSAIRSAFIEVHTVKGRVMKGSVNKKLKQFLIGIKKENVEVSENFSAYIGVYLTVNC